MNGVLPRERPPWLKVRAPSGKGVSRVEEVLRKNGLVTVCREARCPNVGECWGEGTATVLILGDRCSRACAFCSVASGHPAPPDSTEPARLAAASAELAWRHLVVTSVTRDDLPDGGAAQFAQVVKELRQLPRPPSVELLVPDFAGDRDALAKVVRARPDILAHNVETVPRLYSRVRPRASYERSLALLSRVHATAPGLALKSGLMVGFGETRREVIGVMEDLFGAGCRSVTVGQYLPPSRSHAHVAKYYSVEEFEELRDTAYRIGFARVASGPLVRSSYKAAGKP
jgi:lipoic acid synthetase